MAGKPDPLLVALGATIRELRAERELSQEQLGLRSGVHRNYIGGLERAERRPSVVTIARLAETLGIRTSDVFRRAERRMGRGAR